MKKFRLLRADEIECRISQVKENGVALLLYKTARTDADILDETVGADRWENDFKLIDGVLYGGIGVDYGNGLVWKWDAGTESNTEAEKGRASDAFKRAGFKHGIGRELYSAPFIWIPADKCNIRERGNGYACYDTFDVAHIGYDKDERINELSIALNGREVFYLGKYKSAAEKRESAHRSVAKELVCERCGKKLTMYKDGNGNNISIAKWVDGTKKTFGRVLCDVCVKSEA